MSIPHWLIPVIAYLLGSIPFGLLIVKARGGPDLRSAGSGNIGAANVARTAGAVAGLLTLLLDAGKGYLAGWIAERLANGATGGRWMMIAAVAAVLGHMFPVWLRFKGGKGVATGLGVLLPICREAVPAGAGLWVWVVFFGRCSSLGSMVAAAALPVVFSLLYAPPQAPPTYVILGTILISLLVLAKHRSNMERLVAGKESRLKFRR